MNWSKITQWTSWLRGDLNWVIKSWSNKQISFSTWFSFFILPWLHCWSLQVARVEFKSAISHALLCSPVPLFYLLFIFILSPVLVNPLLSAMGIYSKVFLLPWNSNRSQVTCIAFIALAPYEEAAYLALSMKFIYFSVWFSHKAANYLNNNSSCCHWSKLQNSDMIEVWFWREENLCVSWKDEIFQYVRVGEMENQRLKGWQHPSYSEYSVWKIEGWKALSPSLLPWLLLQVLMLFCLLRPKYWQLVEWGFPTGQTFDWCLWLSTIFLFPDNSKVAGGKWWLEFSFCWASCCCFSYFPIYTTDLYQGFPTFVSLWTPLDSESGW